MQFLSDLSIGWSFLLYAVSVMAVWLVGTRLAALVDQISDRTGLGKAFAGFMLLAIATSFPEFVTVIASARIGEGDLVGSNMAGGVCMQTAVLIVADFRYGKKALTGSAPESSNLTGGVLVMLLLSIALAGFVLGDYNLFWHLGTVGIVLFAGAVAGMWIMYTTQSGLRWQPENKPEISPRKEDEKTTSTSTKKLYGTFFLFMVAIGVFGTIVTYTSESIASHWNIGEGFAGAVFIAISTSLPELSATVQAVKLQRSTMAIGNIFGSNVYDIGLLFLADLILTKGILFSSFTKVTGFYFALGALLTAIYLLGMLERKDRAYFRLGVDSWAVLVIYAFGLALSYFISK